MKTTISVPTSLNDITLGEYKEFVSLGELPEVELQMETIRIFCHIPLVSVRRMRATDISAITAEIFNMLDSKPALINRFKMHGVEYGFIPNLDDMTFGEYHALRMEGTATKLQQKAIEMALAGNSTMMIFALKNLANWSDRQEITDTVSINMTIDKQDEEL